jgi:hypothetical protein
MSPFSERFDATARVVRRALSLRHVLDAATVGALAGVAVAGAAWALRGGFYAALGLAV